MKDNDGCIRWCTGLLVAVLALRVFGGYLARISRPGSIAAMMYLETGRVIRPAVATVPPATQEAVSPALLTREEAAAVEVSSFCDLQPDVAALAAAELQWDLTDGDPAVLILHTHAMESYEKEGEDYHESSPYHTADTGYNMVSIGELLTAQLEEAGISVIHDRALHDAESYDDAYEDARQSVEAYLAQYPTIRLILDIHRDAAEQDGQQIVTTCMAGEVESAKLMFVMGSDAGGYDHPYWEENLAIAVKLQAILSRDYPDLFRPLQLSAGRYNQYLHSGFLLVEVGTAGNTHAQAAEAVRLLGEGIIALARGAKGSETG